MPYVLDWSAGNGKIPIVINTKTTNTTASSLIFYGKNSPRYGEGIQENLLHLLENFAAPSPPQNITVGQIWFDTNTSVLKVWNGIGFVNVGGTTSSTTAPISPVLGAFWYDITNDMFKYWDGTQWAPLISDEPLKLKLDKIGGTITGTLMLSRDPTIDLEAATKHYVDEQIKTVQLGTYDISGSVFGKPGSNVTLTRFIVPRGLELPVALAGSYARCVTTPSANHSFIIRKNGGQIGTINWRTGSTDGTFTFGTLTRCTPGDIISVHSPAAPDTLLADAGWTFVATLI